MSVALWVQVVGGDFRGNDEPAVSTVPAITSVESRRFGVHSASESVLTSEGGQWLDLLGKSAVSAYIVRADLAPFG